MSEAVLPEGWATTALGKLLSEPLRNGHSARATTNGTGVRTLTLTAVTSGKFSDENTKLTSAIPERVRDLWLEPGDILVERSNTPELVGTARLFRGPARWAIFPDLVIRARVSSALPEFVELALSTAAARSYFQDSAQGTAGSMPKIDQTIIENFPMAVPPLAEQKRIVAKAGGLLARVDTARVGLARVPEILRRLRQSVLAAACEGRLTEDWREKLDRAESSATRVQALKTEHIRYGARRGNAAPPTEEAHDLDAAEFPSTWTLAELETLCEPGRPITYGILKPGPNVPGGVPYVRVADYPRDRILDPAGIRRTSSKIAADYQRSTLRAGDLLLAIRGTYGRVCRVPPLLSGGNITQDTARLSIHPSVNADYVAWCLRSPGAQDRMKRAAKGVAVRGINIGDVRALQIPLPPGDEQAEIVRRVEALFNFADAIEKRIAAATGRVERMTQAILAKAFRGELVPTDADLARRRMI